MRCKTDSQCTLDAVSQLGGVEVQVSLGHTPGNAWWVRVGQSCAVLFVLGLIGSLHPKVLLAQGPSSELERHSSNLAAEVELLDDPSYRQRQLARWRLQMYPQAAIPVIRDTIHEANHNTGSHLIDLLTIFATQSDINISLQAMDLLSETAADIGAVGRLAKNSLSAIGELQEEQAIEILLNNEAYIGPRNFKINAQVDQGDEMALHINNRFSGNTEAIKWIRFLKSVQTVYLEGEKIDSRIIKAISELTQVKNLKLRHVNLRPQDLRLLTGFDNLQHLGINYVSVSDQEVEILAEFPVSETLRLYGTRVTQNGIRELKKQLDGVDIYVGRGGFLGVATGRLDTRVTMVTPNSGEERGGIRTQDRLTEINGVPIQNFEDLRGELGKCVPDETIKVKLMRGAQLLEVAVTLTEDSD